MAVEIPQAILERLAWADRVVTQTLEALERDPTNAQDALTLLAPLREPSLPAPWKRPTVEMRLASKELVHRAVWAVKIQAEQLPGDTVYTGLEAYPEAKLVFAGAGDAPDFAPLTTLCLDDNIFGGLKRLVIEAHSWLTRGQTDREGIYPHDAYPGELGVELMKLVNEFLLTEVILWTMAADGGFKHGVPYPVRYSAAAYLWSPDIPSAAFCLRCGNFHQLQRAGRRTETHPRTVPVCRRCLRSRISTWPPHAVMPDVRGKWWLRCSQPKCSYVFVGPSQAKKCPAHKHRNLSRQQRQALTTTDDTGDYFEL